MAKERTIEDIRAEMAGNRASLQASFASLRESVEPRNVIKSSLDDVKSFAQGEFDEVKKQFVDDQGTLRTERVVAIAGAVAGVLVLAITLKSISGRRQLAARARKAIAAS